MVFFVNKGKIMAYRVVSKYHRPNTSIDWHVGKVFDQSLTHEIMEMMYTEFHGRKVRTLSELDNNLTLEIEFIWDDQEIYEDWASRTLVIRQQELINEYNASVGITADPKEKTEI